MARPSEFSERKQPWSAWLTPTALTGLDKLAERYGYPHRGRLLEAIGRGDLVVGEIEPSELTQAIAAVEGLDPADLLHLLAIAATKADTEITEILEKEP